MFRLEIVNVYLTKYALSWKKSRRLRERILPGKRWANDELRYDKVDHYHSRFEKQKRCGYW